MVDTTMTPIPRPNRRQSQTKPRPQTQGWDSLIDKAFAQQPTPNITPRNSMLTNPTIPTIINSPRMERSLPLTPARSVVSPQASLTRADSQRKSPPRPAHPPPTPPTPKDQTPRPSSPASTATKFSPVGSSIELPPEEQEDSLDPLWAKVRAKKLEKMMALPSKVKSLEGHVGDLGDVMVGLLGGMGKLGKVAEEREESESPRETKKSNDTLRVPAVENTAAGKDQIAEPTRKSSGPKKTVTRRPSIVTFKESPDGSKAIAIFEMAGVRKQDMHVTYRVGPTRLVVVWRRIRTVEKMEDNVLVRERQEKQYSQIIPLPEGTKFKEIRATRDGKRLTLTYPNIQAPMRLTPDTSMEVEPFPKVDELPSPESVLDPPLSVIQTPPVAPQLQEPQYEEPEYEEDEIGPPEKALSDGGETAFYTCIQIDGDDDWSPYSTPSKRQ